MSLHLSEPSVDGHKGVKFAASGRYIATYATQHIGTFDTAVEAAVAYARTAPAPPAALGQRRCPRCRRSRRCRGSRRRRRCRRACQEGPSKDGPLVRRAAADDEAISV